MLKRAALVFVFVVSGAAALTAQQKLPPYVWAPLPPELAPEAKIAGSITITPKQFLPHPGTAFGVRRPSGFIPMRCRKSYDLKTPAVLDCWLEENAQIANAISWDGRRWRSWTADEKAELRTAFQTVRNWRASGFGPWPGPAFEEPPVNHEAPYLSVSELDTVIDSGEARRQFVAQTAVMLASEIDGWVPWSLRDYPPDVLDEMLRSDLYQFQRDRDDGSALDSVYHGHIVTGGLTPAHVATIYPFLIHQGIIGSTAFETIGRLLEWSRDHMAHYYALYDSSHVELPARLQYEAFWQYSGRPPVARLIEGTILSDPTFPMTERYSWTAGCTGTTRFLRAVLRVVNIPVREIIRPETGSHDIPYFAGEGLYLSHGDDPYGRDFTSGDFTGYDLLINSDQWMRWFPPGSTGQNVGRRTFELNLHRPSRYVVGLYCEDQRLGLSHADGSVFRSYASHYVTLAELEATGFYGRLAALAATSCVTE